MNASPRPAQERRHHPRLTPPNARVQCVSGQFDELSGPVNFARRLVNVGLGGVCIETSGRLRPDIALSVEVRFDDVGGALRSKAQVVWIETVNAGDAEAHRMGLKFLQPELSNAVREFLEGGRASMIVARRRAEYEDLKQKAETRKASIGSKKSGVLKKTVVALLALLVCYIGSFWGFVLAGRDDAGRPAFRYRYLRSKEAGVEETLSKIYSPLHWGFRKAGVPLAYDPS